MGIDKALKVGDRVRFMDATGGGVVRRVLRSSGVVYVEDESGFEVPMLQSEVLKVEGPETSLSSKESPLPSPNKATSQPEIRPTVKRSSDSEGERLNVSLCYLPEEGGQIGRCRYEVYLRDIADYAVVKSMYDKRFPDTPKVFVHAPVCRPGWLIEMECMGVKALKNKEYAPF